MENSAFLRLRDRDNFHNGCKSRDNRNLCGGCRARAYFYGSDMLGDGPGRINNRRQRQSIGS